MSYKVQNISNNMDKRSPYFNKHVNVDTGSGQQSISPGQSIIMDSTTIPITIRRLQLEHRIKLDHLSDKETRDLLKPPPPIEKPHKKPHKDKPVVKEEKKVIKSTKKTKTIKKKTIK